MQFKPIEPGIEVIGQAVYAIVDGFGIAKALTGSHLKNAGLPTEIKSDEWYSQEKWLKAFESIAKLFGDDTLFRIGLKIPENAIYPPFVKDIDTAIQAIDFAYHLNHRKNGRIMADEQTETLLEGIGHYGYQRITGANKIISECNNPYPDSFDMGIITCMARKFMPKATVSHDDSKPCRKKGANSCTYIISW